jgi:outer membrane immunogenic protein
LTTPPIFEKWPFIKGLTRVIIVFCACNALALIAFASPEPLSNGEEMKQVAPAPPSCDYTWTGFYIGANAGYGWGNADTQFEPQPNPVSFGGVEPTTLQPESEAGVIGGGQIGYNYQWNRFVLGAEADFQGSDVSGTKVVSPIINVIGRSDGPGTFLEAHEKTDWFGTVRLRIGFTPFCRLLLYGTGGLAYGHVNYAATSDFSAIPPARIASFDKIKAGWTAGGGFEYALTQRWSVKVEYLYYDLGDESSIGLPRPLFRPEFHLRYNWDTTAHTLRGGLNFKF